MRQTHSLPKISFYKYGGHIHTGLYTLKRILSSPLTLVLVLVLYLLFGLVLSDWVTWGWFLVGVMICAIPGWVATKFLYGLDYARRLDSLGHTLILGLLLTTFMTILLAVIGLGLAVSTMLIAALGSALVLFLSGHWVQKPVSVQEDDDPALLRLAITVGLLVVLIVIAVPFLNVGQKVADSYAYAPYFNRDFFRNVAFGATLSQGVVPPENPYFGGETLHYYWFQMVFPALVYRLSGWSGVLEDIFLLSTLLINMIFVFIFVHFLRRFVKKPTALILVLLLAFVAESYQAPFKAILSLQPTHWAMEGTWLGAIALPPVGYFFQSLLYLPHHFAALVTLLLVISLLIQPSSLLRVLAAAAILILASGFSFFIIAFGFGWAGSYLALQALTKGYSLIKSPASAQLRSSLMITVFSGLLIGLAGLVTYGLLVALDMVLAGGTAWYINVNKFQLMAPLHFLVMLGPMFVLGLAGFVLCLRQVEERPQFYGLFWLLFTLFFIITFLVPRNLPPWEASQKLGIVLRIPLLVFSGVFLDYLLTRDLKHYRLTWTLLLLFCASAAPNLLAYQYVHWNIRNSNLLTYIDASERQAAVWIRQQTPLEAVVQTWPGGQSSVGSYYRGEGIYSLVPVFGYRQTAIGDPQFARYYLPRSRYPEVDNRAAEISQIYEEPEPVKVTEILEKFQIDYVYWGLSEKECCGDNLSWYEKSSLFEKVYDQEAVAVFRFKRS